MSFSDVIGLAGLIVGIIGVVISVIGFLYTLHQVKKTKNAAEASKEAALETKDKIRNLDSVIDFSTVLTIIEEIKRHQRGGNWVVLPDRYSALRSKLVAIKSQCPGITDLQKSVLQGAITQFKNIEGKIDVALTDHSTPDVTKLNRLVSAEFDRLNEVLLELKTQI
jgi:hypothetical protein